MPDPLKGSRIAKDGLAVYGYVRALDGCVFGEVVFDGSARCNASLRIENQTATGL